MTILHLVRHGQTDWNRAQRIQGTTDIPLNATGRAQARAAARRLEGAVRPARVVSSDLGRAFETAQIIAEHLGLDAPTPDRRLQERAYGEAEGVTVAEFERRWGDWRTARVPGAEQPAEVAERALDAILALAHTHDDIATLLVVTHGAFIRAAVAALTDGARPAPGEHIANGGGFTLRFENGHVTVEDAAPQPA